MRTTTGDENKAVATKSVSMLNVGIVLKTDLTDATKPINARAYSGKDKGGLVVGVDADGTNPVLYMASGPNAADAWLPQGPGTSTAPGDATTTTAGVVKQSAAVANQAAVTVSGADVAALVKSTNAALATLVSKINALLAAERTSGQLAP
ncbi:head fiber protein [Pantoea phage Nufs112]|nr:head fiber protein [Pantoea phage Nufs112]